MKKQLMIIAVTATATIAQLNAMHYYDHSDIKQRTELAWEVFTRIAKVVDSESALPIFLSLQCTAKAGTQKYFVVPYITAVQTQKNYHLNQINNALSAISKSVRKEIKDKKYEKYYARQQEALHIAPTDYDTWRDYTPAKVHSPNQPSVNELQEKKLIAQRKHLMKEIRFLSLKKSLVIDNHTKASISQ